MYMRAGSLATNCHGLAQLRGGFQAVISQDQNNADGVGVPRVAGAASSRGVAWPPLPAAVPGAASASIVCQGLAWRALP